MIGSYGDFEFVVGDGLFKTFHNLQISDVIRYGKHDTLQGKPRIEYIGENLKELHFNLFWSIEMRVNPEQEMEYFYTQMREGKANPFMVGSTKIGDYIVESISKNDIRIDNRGNILAAVYNLGFLEWIPDRTLDDVVDEYVNEFVSEIKNSILSSKEINHIITPYEGATTPITSFMKTRDLYAAANSKNPSEATKKINEKYKERRKKRDAIDDFYYLENNEAPDSEVIEINIQNKLKSELQSISNKRARNEALERFRSGRK